MILTYLIKSTLCLGILFGFYKIALENKAMHHFKRFYLLASLVFAFTIPLVTFTYTTTISQEVVEEQWAQDFAQEYEESPTSSPQVVQAETDYTSTIIWSLYGLGVLIFGIRFGLNLVRLKRKINTAQLFEERDFTIALLGKAIVPHSFFKWIFLNKNQYLNQEIAPEVIAHEATHVRQKHSWDILFVEFLQVVFWFNPLVWLSNISIKLNHEFLADQGAIINKSNIAIYQNILLSYASSAHHTALESPFNYSLTKKRIVMLSQSFSRKRFLISTLFLLPVIAGCLFLFNNKIEQQSPEIAAAPEIAETPKIYARSISLKIVDDTYYEIEENKISKQSLAIALEGLNTDLTKIQRDKVINIHIKSRSKVPYEEMLTIQKIVAQYGYHRIVTPFQEIIRSKGNDPVKWHLETQDPYNIQYAKKHLAGAQRNGKK